MLICARPDVMVSLRNISWPPTLHIHKAGLKDLYSLISTLSAFLFPAPFCSLHIPCYQKCQTLQGTSPTPPHIWSTVISQESEVPTNAFPVVVFPSPDQHTGLLNTCLWEVLLLRRFCDFLLYQALGHHPARLLISHALFTYLFVSQAYPAMSQSIPHQWPQDQDCLQVQSLWV